MATYLSCLGAGCALADGTAVQVIVSAATSAEPGPH